MFRRLLLIGLGALLMLVVSACGQTASTGSTADGGTQTDATTAYPSTGDDGMETTSTATDDGAMPMETTSTAMDHGAMPMDMTSTPMDDGGMAMGSGPFDAQFIDGMTEHHTGAIAMAEQALTESERPEIKELAQNIISSQQQEVEQMTTWREQWYPDLEPTGGMSMSMGDMEISTDTSQPFDQRFIAAMIGHHNGAIMMANEALTKAEHPEIKQLAEAIIKAQESEVAQMQQWNSEWFGG